MTEVRDVPTPEEDAYARYLAVTDALDEAILLAQEADGQRVDDELRARRRELEELRAELGLPRTGDQVAELETER